jgi:hypothetical protein
VDTCGPSRLLDTNQLINTHPPPCIPWAGDSALPTAPVHGRFPRRLIYLDAAFRGCTRHQFAADPLYTRHVRTEDLQRLLQQSVAESGSDPAITPAVCT